MFDSILNTPQLLLIVAVFLLITFIQMQPSRGVLRKRFSENMQQICRRKPKPNCDFNLLCNFIEITLWYGCSPVNLLHIFKIHFPKNTPGRLLLLM